MRSLWLGLGLTLVGGLALHGVGCSSSNNSGGGGGSNGGACCFCASPECGTTRTLSAPSGTTIPDCKSYCQTQAAYLANCSSGSPSTITGSAINCPADGGASTGAGGSPGLGGSLGGAGRGGSAAGAAGAGGSVSSVPDGGTANFGLPCATNADCGGGLQCITDTAVEFMTGVQTPVGYPNGLCSLPCTRTSNPCSPAAGLGTCVLFTQTSGFCVETCNVGPIPAGGQKCHNRPDEACQPVDPTSATSSTACMPQCGTDADCGSRHCDPFSGLCLDQVMPVPIGKLCDPNAATNPCGGGFCLSFTGNTGGITGMCSAFCTFGALESCGWSRSPISGTSGTVGGCLTPVLQAGDIGDQGFCFQLCDNPSNCAIQNSPDWTCRTDLGIRPVFGHDVCYFPPLSDAGSSSTSDSGGQ